jgi:hypothetical protein
VEDGGLWRILLARVKLAPEMFVLEVVTSLSWDFIIFVVGRPRIFFLSVPGVPYVGRIRGVMFVFLSQSSSRPPENPPVPSTKRGTRCKGFLG